MLLQFFLRCLLYICIRFQILHIFFFIALLVVHSLSFPCSYMAGTFVLLMHKSILSKLFRQLNLRQTHALVSCPMHLNTWVVFAVKGFWVCSVNVSRQANRRVGVI